MQDEPYRASSKAIEPSFSLQVHAVHTFPCLAQVNMSISPAGRELNMEANL